jgi:hypothetical protein
MVELPQIRDLANLPSVKLTFKVVYSLIYIYKEEAGQRRPREGGSAGPNLESEQEEYTRMEEVPAGW